MPSHVERCPYCGSLFSTSNRHRYCCSDKCRVLVNVNFSDNNKCWPYAGSHDTCGYGKITLNGKEHKAHRFLWELHNGAIPKGMFVLHHCDNPPCCNPAHLYLGTNKDNVRDMVLRHRCNPTRGSANWQAKLNESQVPAIKIRLSNGDSLSKIGHDYGVSPITIFDIKHNKTWAHV